MYIRHKSLGKLFISLSIFFYVPCNSETCFIKKKKIKKNIKIRFLLMCLNQVYLKFKASLSVVNSVWWVACTRFEVGTQ